MSRPSENFDILSDAIYCREFLDHLNGYELLNNGFATWNSLHINTHMDKTKPMPGYQVHYQLGDNLCGKYKTYQNILDIKRI
jgi:hypothetical protein